MPNHPKVIVTGSSGFIGQHLGRQLRLHGYTVEGWDQVNTRVGNTPPDRKADLAVEPFDPTGAYTVYHLAAEADLALCEADPQRAFDSARAALNVFAACARHRVPVVFTSTCQVYGRPEVSPIPETHPRRPGSTYAQAKALAEDALFWYREHYRQAMSVARLFNVYGQGQEDAITYRHTFIQDKIRQVRREKTVKLAGQYLTRDFVHVVDVVRALMAIGTALVGGYAEPVYNVGSGETVSLGGVLTEICTQLDRHPQIEYAPGNEQDIGFGDHPVRALITGLGSIGAAPSIGLETGVALLIQHLEEYDKAWGGV